MPTCRKRIGHRRRRRCGSRARSSSGSTRRMTPTGSPIGHHRRHRRSGSGMRARSRRRQNMARAACRSTTPKPTRVGRRAPRRPPPPPCGARSAVSSTASSSAGRWRATHDRSTRWARHRPSSRRKRLRLKVETGATVDCGYHAYSQGPLDGFNEHGPECQLNQPLTGEVGLFCLAAGGVPLGCPLEGALTIYFFGASPAG
mmetsp:Transcript_93842/g.201492  ORF Transcript_93842/g.201492 Transcript_93842/m.201492 type:complete len:201 (-) Transcript_93842:121-723(-)